MKHQYVSTVANTPSQKVSSDRWNERHIWVAEAEPDDSEVGEDKAIEWMSNGTGYGNAGDLCVKINVGGTIKKATRTPFTLIR